MTTWMKFQQECPIIARVPIFRHWAFGVFVRAYEDMKARLT